VAVIKAQAPRIATRDTRAVKPPPKQADAFYLSADWRALIAHLLKQRGRRCEQCGRTRDRNGAIRIFGDHVIELRDGGAPLDPRNCRLLCGSCHTRKTVAERARRLRGDSDVRRGEQVD
jgi:5-methylcytosine-specific restriction protein A